MAAPIPAATDSTINPPSRNFRIVGVVWIVAVCGCAGGCGLAGGRVAFNSSFTVLLDVVIESLWGLCVCCFSVITDGFVFFRLCGGLLVVFMVVVV